jgi:hypothetical protein
MKKDCILCFLLSCTRCVPFIFSPGKKADFAATNALPVAKPPDTRHKNFANCLRVTSSWMFVSLLSCLCLLWMHQVITNMMKKEAPQLADKFEKIPG